MFVDASAIVAIITREPEAAALAAALQAAQAPISSSIAVFEATLGIRRKKDATVEAARQEVHDFLRLARVRLVEIAPDAATLALDTFARYGKGRGHPAQLNMGDCFAYAVAQRHAAPLLFKGGDFDLTDIPVA